MDYLAYCLLFVGSICGSFFFGCLLADIYYKIMEDHGMAVQRDYKTPVWVKILLGVVGFIGIASGFWIENLYC